jgi:hypothetical protein
MRLGTYLFFWLTAVNLCLTGPGKHLKGLTLMDGVVQPEDFDYFRKSCTAEFIPLSDVEQTKW